MSENRWIQEPRQGHGSTVVPFPANLRLEVTYLTDPEIHAAVLPPPLTAPPEPRVRVHFTRIEVEREAARDRELVPARRDVRRHARPVLRGHADRPRDRGHAEP